MKKGWKIYLYEFKVDQMIMKWCLQFTDQLNLYSGVIYFLISAVQKS